MSRKSSYEQLVAKVSAALRQHAEKQSSWREALADARGVSRVLGMVPCIRDVEGNAMTELSDGRLQLMVGEEEVRVEENEMDQALTQRGLQDHQWH
jgi:hypothetical protein